MAQPAYVTESFRLILPDASQIWHKIQRPLSVLQAGVPFLSPSKRLARLSLGANPSGNSAKRRRHSEPSAPLPLAGMRLLVSCSKERISVKGKIQSLGGIVLPSIPPTQVSVGEAEALGVHTTLEDIQHWEALRSNIVKGLCMAQPCS